MTRSTANDLSGGNLMLLNRLLSSSLRLCNLLNSNEAVARTQVGNEIQVQVLANTRYPHRHAKARAVT